MDFETARLNMVESQVRPNGVTDRRIIAAFATVPREAFVPEAMRPVAYMGEAMPLAHGRQMPEPMALARLIGLAAVTADDLVLHVGCATGYATALLGRLARRVVAIDQEPELATAAAAALARLGVANAEVMTADHASGAAKKGPYDVIFVEGSVPELPPDLAAQLAEGGRLVAATGSAGAAKAVVWTRAGGALSRRTTLGAALAPLPGFPRDVPAFVF